MSSDKRVLRRLSLAPRLHSFVMRDVGCVRLVREVLGASAAIGGILLQLAGCLLSAELAGIVSMSRHRRSSLAMYSLSE
jgi:hypothetical protein